MRPGWVEKAFDDVLVDCTGGNAKTLQSEYLSNGEFAVVDQGQELIAGFVNDSQLICKAMLPAIIFGDHTRIFKYADFPFCLGADGVKVLRPKIEADARFLFHQLRSFEIPEAGYSRHFKFLKRMRIALPPLEEQRRIAAILDKADALRQKRRTALQKLDSLTQSIFLDMFGDSAMNPKNWPLEPLGNLWREKPIYGTMIPPGDTGEWLSLRVGNIQNGQLDLSDRKYVSLPDASVRRHTLVDGDLVMARAIASQDHLGKCIVVQTKGEQWAFDSHLMRLRLNHAFILPEYLRVLLQTPGGRSIFLAVTRRSAVQFNVNTGEMNGLRVPLAPINDQRRFVDFCNSVSVLSESANRQHGNTLELFSSLQHRAFRGEL